MKAFVDQDRCIGCGLCESTCPEVFEIKNGLSHVIVDELDESVQEDALEAQDLCPVGAITIE